MKLYLSSIGVPNSKALTKLFPNTDDLRVAIIPNAWDVYPEKRRNQEKEKTQVSFTELGFKPTLIDISTLQSEGLRSILASSSLIWVMGGNSFYLNHLIHKSGLSSIINSLLAQGLVYGGESAGAVVACPTLHGVELMDSPDEAPEIIWEGLNLVNFGIVPHWGIEEYAENLENCKAEMAKFVEVRTLTNGQALVVADNNIKLVEKEH